MKFASLKNGRRDGCLLVVSRDLRRAVAVPHLAPTLQAALDDWDRLAPRLQEVTQAINSGAIPGEMPFRPEDLHSPLPRAYQWADGSAYVNHVELVRKARGATMPAEFWTDPLMYQGGSDSFLGPCDPIVAASEDWGIDFEAEVAVITGDLPMSATPEACAAQIRLLMLVNDVSLRKLIAAELAKGFGFFQSKPASSFSPVAVTPDELGEAWREGKLHRPLNITLNGAWFGCPDAGVDMTFAFPTLMAHATKTRELEAGSIIGSGTVSNLDKRTGSGCIAERRCLETLAQGQPVTPYLKFGDRVKIEMFDAKGQSIFGAIDQRVSSPVIR